MQKKKNKQTEVTDSLHKRCAELIAGPSPQKQSLVYKSGLLPRMLRVT